MKTCALACTILIEATFLLSVSSPDAAGAMPREEAAAYRAEGYERQQAGDFAGAIESYGKAIEADPTYAAPYNDRGVVLEGQGWSEDSLLQFQTAITIDPHYQEAHANLAIVYEQTGETGLAIQHWQKRYELGDPDDPGTGRAAQRLVDAGLLEAQSGSEYRRSRRERILDDFFEQNDVNVELFESVTHRHGDWP